MGNIEMKHSPTPAKRTTFDWITYKDEFYSDDRKVYEMEDVKVRIDGFTEVTFFMKFTKKKNWDTRLDVSCRDFMNDRSNLKEIPAKIMITLTRERDGYEYESRSSDSFLCLNVDRPTFRSTDFPCGRTIDMLDDETGAPLVLLCQLEPVPWLLPLGKNSKMLEEELFTDATLVSGIDGAEIRCHKSFLAASSPVFEAMFKHDMQEKQSGRVVVEDLTGKTIRALLEFIYKNSVGDISEVAVELLHAADKYQMPTLTAYCLDALIERMTISNFYQSLGISSTLDSKELKKACFEFFSQNKGMVDTEEWKEFQKTQPDDAMECLTQVVRKPKRKRTKVGGETVGAGDDSDSSDSEDNE